MKRVVEVAYAEYIVLDPNGDDLYIVYDRGEASIARGQHLAVNNITTQSERDKYKISTRYRFLRYEELEPSRESEYYALQERVENR